MTTKDLQIALGNCKARHVGNRMAALGMLETCTRCAGSGHHSFNLTHGTMCFGCDGRGTTVPKRITKKLCTAVTAKIEAGGLDSYFEANRVSREFKAKIKPLMAELQYVWCEGECHVDYKRLRPASAHDTITSWTGLRVHGINRLWSAAKRIEREQAIDSKSAFDTIAILVNLIKKVNQTQAADKVAKHQIIEALART
jgi:hypothetical protein